MNIEVKKSTAFCKEQRNETLANLNSSGPQGFPDRALHRQVQTVYNTPRSLSPTSQPAIKTQTDNASNATSAVELDQNPLPLPDDPFPEFLNIDDFPVPDYPPPRNPGSLTPDATSRHGEALGSSSSKSISEDCHRFKDTDRNVENLDVAPLL